MISFLTWLIKVLFLISVVLVLLLALWILLYSIYSSPKNINEGIKSDHDRAIFKEGMKTVLNIQALKKANKKSD